MMTFVSYTEIIGIEPVTLPIENRNVLNQLS
jgi:hypothetical protein